MPNNSSPAALQKDSALTLEAVLQQVHFNCRSGQWAQAIANCETIIAQCNQQLQKGAIAAESTAKKAAAKADSTPINLSADQIAKGEAYLTSAQQLKQSGDIAGSVQAYLQALQQNPRLVVAYNRLRYNLMRYNIPVGDPLLRQVADVCQKIVAQYPQLLLARVALGYALTKSGQRAAAIDCYRQLGDRMVRRQLAEQFPHRSADALADTLVSDAAAPSTRFNGEPSEPTSEPSFLIIGAEKCGTTSLYHYLRQHPAVMTPIEKEIDFFDTDYAQGIDWYLAHFPTIPPKTGWITGETSANYLYSDVAPQRVFKHFPRLKLAVILRNPVDRSISRYSMMVRNGAEKRSLAQAVQDEIVLMQAVIKREGDIPWRLLDRCRHVGNSLYYYHLRRWLTYFDQRQLLVLRSEALFAEPEKTLQQLYQHFGLAPHTEPSYPKYNSGQYSSADSDVRQTLATFFEPYNRQLEALLDQTFDWRV